MLDYDEILRQNSILEGERIVLRPFSLDDVNDVFLYASFGHIATVPIVPV